MNKREFLQALDDALSTLVPDRERQETLRYYREYFEEAGPEREAELIQELGDPRELAQKIAREGGFSGGETAEAPKKPNRWKWALGITGAVVVLLAGTFAALSALNAQFLLHFDFLPGSSQAASTPPGGTESGTPGSSSPGTESQQPSQGAVELDGTFVRLDLDIILGDVSIRTGSDWGLTLESSGQDRHGEDYLLHYSLEHDTLSIWSTPEQLNTDGSSEITARVEITVPEGWTLERVSLDTVSGDVTLTEVTADEVSVDTTSGDVTAQRLTAGSIRLETVSGDVNLGCPTAPSEVSLDSVSGDLSLSGPLSPDTRLTTTSGDIEITADSTEEECAYDLSCVSGGIRIGGTSIESSIRKAEGELSLNANSVSGDITVSFGG